ncbi:putative methyltransferase [Paramagnetospirillum magnetotacticum MS-1]|uniref:Putative methyltransferase n=1 Tax=Paramagnetospirillum magnetotacticum MS-1 TaxID=272627 RepID=A0A0C2YRK0_PARME|nr:class I SAM-dependent methyltransferase [Paramagnetospirillum magnetotacticum]KIL97758.1 putative methyltransferase [Paramagnetospirillum magnetotacticum MS-1]
MTVCIACGSTKVEPFLDLHETTLANKFLAPEEIGAVEPRHPLVVGFCPECSHVQLTHLVPPAAMFEDYLYISSLSKTLVGHLHGLAATVIERFKLGADDLFIDVGCNDGTLLSEAKRRGVRILGIDPAKNLAPLAKKNGVDTLVAFFGTETAAKVVAEHGKASVVTATNVFPHIPVLDDLVKGLDVVLKPGGVFVAEAHYLGDLLDACAFDTVYHEHCSYWSLHAAQYMFQRHGFEVVDIQRLPIHHGQLRLFAMRKGEGQPTAAVATLLAEEVKRGMTGIECYRAFAKRVEAIREELHAAFAGFKAAGKTVVGYGAPAKGNTLLSYIGFGPEQLAYIADKSPLKQGRVTPGTHIPVVGPERLLADQPDYVLLLAWNFADEILVEQAEYRARGGKFILPVPEVKIV